MSDEPSVVELLEQLTQRDVLIGQLQEQLAKMRVALAAAQERIAELGTPVGTEFTQLGSPAVLGGIGQAVAGLFDEELAELLASRTVRAARWPGLGGSSRLVGVGRSCSCR